MFRFIDFVVFAVLLAIFYFWAKDSINEAIAWEEFKTLHKCVEVSHIKGDHFDAFGLGANGQLVISTVRTPDKHGWVCDDGKTYFR